MNALADAAEHTLRISIDTKATVHVGDYARGGRSRGVEAVKALVDAIYEKGVKLCGNEKRELGQRLERSAELNWWDISIPPKTVLL